MRMFLLAFVALLFAAGEPALAQTAPWRVSEASGDVRIVEGGRTRPATRGALLSGGSVVTTAQRSRAVLVRGRDYVIVSPASRVRVPTAAQGGSRGLVQMIAEAGTTMFRIEHRATPHFAVQTPYLAAVVKGTVFTVTVSEAGASVQVTEGAVEVSTADGGAAELVRSGTIATVSAADLQQLNIQGETNRSIRSNGTAPAGAVIVPPSETGNYQGPADTQVTVVASVTEEPIALAETTGGLVEGNAGIDLALADVRDTARPDVGDNGQAGNANANANGPGTANGGGNDNSGPGSNNGGGNGDPGNSGNGGGNGNSGPGSNSGGGNSDPGNSGNGGGNGNGGPGNDNGGGNGDPGNDPGNSGNSGNSGNGGGNDNSGPGNDNGDPGNDAGNSGNGPGNDNGGGNGDPGNDPGNSGNDGGNDNSGPGNNNGDDDNAGNSGNGGSNDNSGPGNDNGHGNDDDDGDDGGNSGNGGGNDNGHGNDDDDGNSGNGGGNDNSGPGNNNDDDGLEICLPGDLLCVGLGGDPGD